MFISDVLKKVKRPRILKSLISLALLVLVPWGTTHIREWFLIIVVKGLRVNSRETSIIFMFYVVTTDFLECKSTYIRSLELILLKSFCIVKRVHRGFQYSEFFIYRKKFELGEGL